MSEQEDESFKVFSLLEIADWQEATGKNNGLSVHIPAIQRGLVWNATQAEVLWDSLMRGIPIGTFTLIKVENGFELLDGQQRANAIAMGFKAMPSDNDDDDVKRKPLLWIDLGSVPPEGSRCKFVFRVTTPGQPWGYKLPTVTTENNSNRLDTEQRWSVLSDKENEIDRSSIGSKKPYPYQIKKPFGAKKPVLFSTLLAKNSLADVPDDIKRGIEIIRSTKVFALCSPYVMSGDDADWLPTFFTRMNKQGVEPDQEEILYSNVKHLVPELKKADEFAQGRGMRASRMANIMLKVYFSEHEKKWISSVDLKKIRQIESMVDIVHFIDHFRERLIQIDAWCKEVPEPSVPPVTISMFAMGHPAVYQWLLLRALAPDKGGRRLSGKYVIGCATVFAWFYQDGKAEEACNSFIPLNENESLLPLVLNGLLTLPPHPKEIPQNESFPFTGDVWPCFDRYALSRTKLRMSRIWNGFDNKEGCELLLFACRKYMNNVFPAYGCPDSYWQEDNRPWDYDHIVPKAWLASGRGNPQGRFHELVANYLASIGNSTPIPFSVNRSKNADEPKGDYCGEMQFDLYLNKTDLESFKKNPRIEDDENKAQNFVKATSVRLYLLYNAWHESLDIKSLFDTKQIALQTVSLVEARRKSFMRLLEGDDRLKVYGVLGCYEYLLDSDSEEWWYLPWLSIGIESPEGKSFLAISTNGKQWEVGLRKHPALSEVDVEYAKKLPPEANGYRRDNHNWWYYLKEKESQPLGEMPDDICISFKELITQARAKTHADA
jgi:hypothetical protein